MQFSIHEDNLPKLAEKLKRIENKCSKYGCTFHYAEIGEEFRTIQHQKEIIGAYGCKQLAKVGTPILERFITIEVEGKAIINNWEFLATIQHTENGNIIRTFSDFEIPDYYKTCLPNCDHCHSNRDRKDTYLVRNTETNEIKQVGKSCLMDYTNGLSAEAAAGLASYFDAISKLDNGESLGGFTRHYFDTFEFLLAANEVVKKCGFVSKSTAFETSKQPTALKIADILNPDCAEGQKEAEKIGFNPNTSENKTDVENMLQWLQSQEANNQYISNLQIACKNSYCEYRDIGLLASLPAAYFKAMEKESERITREQTKENTQQSAYVGNIGDKITLQNVSFARIASYETQYGITRIYKIIDQNGNIYIWRSANSFEDSASLNIKGTIKNHSEYNGEKQTELTRCKII